MQADPVDREPEATPEDASVSSDRSAQQEEEIKVGRHAPEQARK
jgi:hypothetical protein